MYRCSVQLCSRHISPPVCRLPFVFALNSAAVVLLSVLLCYLRFALFKLLCYILSSIVVSTLLKSPKPGPPRHPACQSGRNGVVISIAPCCPCHRSRHHQHQQLIQPCPRVPLCCSHQQYVMCAFLCIRHAVFICAIFVKKSDSRLPNNRKQLVRRYRSCSMLAKQLEAPSLKMCELNVGH